MTAAAAAGTVAVVKRLGKSVSFVMTDLYMRRSYRSMYVLAARKLANFFA